MKKFIKLQMENSFLWVPFLLAFGAGVFFTSGYNPNLMTLLLGLLICPILFFGFAKNILLRAISIFIFGFVYAGIFTFVINTPIINHDMRDCVFTADVIGIDYAPDKTRLMLRTTSHDIGAHGRDMANVRLTISKLPVPKIGDTVKVTASLFPPDAPYVPGGFDYARWSYFNGLSATGFITDIKITEHGDHNGIDTMRDNLHSAANSFLVDALVLGYKNAIPKNDAQIWTATGVGHIWSISGFHMTLISTWLFAIFWFIFRRIPYITRRITARSVALITSWFGLLFYLILSGIDVATIRAFLMTTLGFMAFIFGRGALSMRNICLAFCLIFLINPHYVMQAGFQLSFAAIFGLIWFWNVKNPKMPDNKILKVICVAILTSVIASIFTAPFVIAHFGSIPIYSLIGNLVLLPVFSIAIMPLIIIGVFSAPLGFHTPIDVAHKIYDYTFILANKIANMPHATITMPDIPNSAIVIMIFGFCCLMFIRANRRWINYAICAACMCAGITIIAMHPRPIFMITHDHELAAFVRDNKITFSKSRASKHFFAFDTWKVAAGISPDVKTVREKPIDGIFRFESENFNLVYIMKIKPLIENISTLCRDENIDYIITYFDITSPSCDNKILRDAFVIYPNGDIDKLNTNRPWHGK